MEQKSLLTRVKDFIIRTEDEQAALDYSISIEDYLSLTDKEFQSKKIMIETKLDVEKVKITLFISVILVAFLAGFTEKMFTFLKLISSKNNYLHQLIMLRFLMEFFGCRLFYT